MFFNLYLLVSLKAIVSFSEQLQSHSHSYTFTLGVVGVQALLAFPKKLMLRLLRLKKQKQLQETL